MRDVIGIRDRFFAIDVFARRNRFAYRIGATVSGLRIEINRIFGVRKRCIQIRGPL
jgi:hypothetical protein